MEIALSPEHTSGHVYAMVPAAGQSRRMGRAKQLIDVRGRPMLVHVLETILAADVARITLITSTAIRQSLKLPETNRVHCVINDDAMSEMIDSIRLGLRDCATAAPLRDTDAVLVCPGDLPALTANDVDVCITALRRRPDRIVIAVRAGRRGHPIIFPAELIPFVESNACDHGLNELPRALPKRVLEVECPSDGILHDVDTPADLDPSRPAE